MNARERWEVHSRGMAWYRCEAVVSSIAILSFSSGLRSHLFFRVLRSHIPSCRLLRCKPRRFPLRIWIRISEYSPLSATNFCGDDPVNTLFFHPWPHFVQHLIDGWESIQGRTTIVDTCKEEDELEVAISILKLESRSRHVGAI